MPRISSNLKHVCTKNRVEKYKTQNLILKKLIKLKKEMGKSTIAARDFNASLLTTDKTTNQVARVQKNSITLSNYRIYSTFIKDNSNNSSRMRFLFKFPWNIYHERLNPRPWYKTTSMSKYRSHIDIFSDHNRIKVEAISERQKRKLQISFVYILMNSLHNEVVLAPWVKRCLF